MYTITGLTNQKARTAFLGGKEYYVAPMTLIVPGVLIGNKGPIYYPPEEVSSNPGKWNLVPIVVNHPSDPQGNFLSAKDPEVMARHGIGFIKDTVYNGKLTTEGWFDKQATKRVDSRILLHLTRGNPIELSTGIAGLRGEQHEEKVHNGVSYKVTARDIIPDHVAVLPDESGACSIKDGCGVLVNKEKVTDPLPTPQEIERYGLVGNEKLSHHQLRIQLSEMLKSRFPHGEYNGEECYVIDVFDKYVVYSKGGGLYKLGYNTDLRAGRVTLFNEQPTRVRQVVTYKDVGNQVGNETPITKEGDTVANSAKEENILWLVGNCSSWKGQGDKEVLNAMSEEKVADLRQKAETVQKTIIDAKKPWTSTDGATYVWDESNKVWNKIGGTPTPTPTPTTVPGVNDAPATAVLNAEQQEMLAFAREEMQRQKNDLVGRLVVNIRDPQAKANAAQIYSNMPLAQLKVIAPEQVPQQEHSVRNNYTLSGLVPMGVGVQNAADDQDDVIPVQNAEWGQHLKRR